MAVRLTEGEKPITGGTGIEVTANKVVNLLLREENNLIKVDENNDVYTDLQLEDGIATTDTLPVGVTTGRVLEADGWVATGTMLAFKTTSGDQVTWIYGDDGKLYIDNGTGTFKQIYLKSEVDALFAQLRSEISAVGYSGEYNDLLNKPTLGTAAALDVGTDAGDIPVIGQDGKLPSSILPAMAMHAFTVATKNGLTTLSDAVAGDIGFVEDENQSYILVREPYSALANWQEYSAVNSVNGYRGVVNLVTDDIPVQGTNNMYVNSNEKNTWNAKLGTNDVATVAITGSYNDLSNKPAIPAGQIQSDWTQADTSSVDYIKHKPTIDSALSTTSTNAIQNVAVATAVNSINSDITSIQGDISTIQGDITNLGTGKQDTLVSGTNIKTLNNNSLLGSGNLDVQETLVSGTNIKTINNESLLGSGNIVIQGGGTTYNAGPGIIIGNYNDYSAMRGPCPEGYHIPSKNERDSVKNIGVSIGAWTSSQVDIFSGYLKLPKAGFRQYDGAAVTAGSRGWYYTCEVYNTTQAYCMRFGGGYPAASTSVDKCNGLNIRSFKDTPEIPNGSWTTVYQGTGGAGIFWNSSLGLISLSSDGTNWITIADKNLGATQVWNSGNTLSQSNCGNFYQWGNNYGFPFTGSVTTSSTKVNAENYGPGNYYNSSTFITGADWTTDHNSNLWGGVAGIVLIPNTISVDMEYIKNHIN